MAAAVAVAVTVTELAADVESNVKAILVAEADTDVDVTADDSSDAIRSPPLSTSPLSTPVSDARADPSVALVSSIGRGRGLSLLVVISTMSWGVVMTRPDVVIE